MAPDPTFSTSIGRHEYMERFLLVISAAFAQDALNQLIIAEKEGLRATGDITIAQIRKHFASIIEDSLNLGGEIIEASSWAGVALWRPPHSNTKKIASSITDVQSVRAQYLKWRDGIREKYLGDSPFWLLHLIGRNPDIHAPGAIRAVVDPYLERARSEGIPVWLEATNTHAKEVYAHFGFRVVSSIEIGGQSPFGVVTAYAMIYSPETVR